MHLEPSLLARRVLPAGVAAVLAGGLLLAPPPDREAPVAGSSPVSVLLGHSAGEQAAVGSAVRHAGGKVTRLLGLIDAQVAVLPSSQVARLAAHPAVAWLAPDRPVEMAHADTAGPKVGSTSLFHLADTVQAKQLWAEGWSGAGVDVAVVDSGVVPVDGLRAAGKVVNGPDLSFESGAAGVRHLDTYGHGTHMAGIIAGRDDAVTTPVRDAGHDRFAGIAPDARIVNVKVADSAGATDVSQVIAAIDWVVQHGRRDGLNIRVLNLSFGTDGVQDYRLDPLAHAVEEAWRQGVVVVTSAGNEGYGDARMNNPAYDPYVIAVGGSDGRGTVSPADDVVAGWSSRGTASRRPDLVAPGQSVVSLRDPGSRIDQDHPTGRVGERFFRGSGTSQAAAVVSGAAALLLQQRPELRPDQVKGLLTAGARRLPDADPAAQGAGLLDVKAAAAAPTPTTRQAWARSLGIGSLELARGSHHVTIDGTTVTGEQSVFLTTWSAFGWLTALAGGTAWSGGSWTGSSWTGNTWTGGSWFGNTWTGNTWTGNTWTGNTWTGNTWTGNTWSSAGW